MLLAKNFYFEYTKDTITLKQRRDSAASLSERYKMSQPSLLDSAIAAHGSLDRWNQLSSISLKMNFSGWLMAIKGYPYHYQPSLHISTKKQYAELRNLGGAPDEKYILTPSKVWIEKDDGTVVEERENPRESYAGHNVMTPWDKLQMSYFVSYAMHNYLTTPFIFTLPGFSTSELPPHTENGHSYRVLEVTFPPMNEFASHCPVQKFYFNAQTFMLFKVEYETEVLSGVVSHYCYDYKKVGGIVFPSFRRVVRRVKETGEAVLDGPSAFTIDYIEIAVKEESGEEAKSALGEWLRL